MESNSFDDYVICPYDKSHKLLRGRLTKHLQRCVRSSDNSNRFQVCPYNSNHRYDKKEFHAHVKICPDRLLYEREWKEPYTMNEPTSRSEASCVNEPVHLSTVECEEDWGQEPDAPTYNPTAYCMQNLVIRTTASHGLTKSERRNLRNAERRRFAENQK